MTNNNNNKRGSDSSSARRGKLEGIPTRHLRTYRDWVDGEGSPPGMSHVRVVVRTQPKEELLLRSLIYGLRAQSEGQTWGRLDFVLVPTEPGSLPVYQRLKEEMGPGFDDLLLLELPDSFYATAKASDPYACTSQIRAAYKERFDAEEVHRYCDFDHYVYYAATDRALLDLVVPCKTCTHVLVTNGDNGYAPDFLKATLRQEEADLAIVGFVHDSQSQRPVIGIGRLDLGAVMMRTKVLDGGAHLFMSSLPPEAGPKEVHDADYHIVKSALERGLTYAILRDRLLMYHH